jgi:hypothetical protein
MNSHALQQQIVGAVNFALQSKQTSPGEVVMILELIKLDMYANLRDATKAQASNIIPVHGRIKPNGE